METVLVTGGAGFIGSNFVLMQRRRNRARVITLDTLTYAGNLMNLAELEQDPDHVFVRGDICDSKCLAETFQAHKPAAVVHFAAESHVDRSIVHPDAFIQTNVVGTFQLLREALTYWRSLEDHAAEAFRFLHVSTDEVYGSLGPDDPPFTEQCPYTPNSPYSASKASSDHLVRAYHHTHGLPVVITNCSNNYGPRQFPEKLIPLMICNCLEGKPLPVYGTGSNIRDWLYVEDHCEALTVALEKGKSGETYNIGGRCEKANLDVVRTLCAVMDELVPGSAYAPHANLIRFVEDRPGHDFRYAIDCSKIESALGWKPAETFEQGLRRTVRWYLDNLDWVRTVQTGEYREWLDLNYGSRQRTGAP